MQHRGKESCQFRGRVEIEDLISMLLARWQWARYIWPHGWPRWAPGAGPWKGRVVLRGRIEKWGVPTGGAWRHKEDEMPK